MRQHGSRASLNLQDLSCIGGGDMDVNKESGLFEEGAVSQTGFVDGVSVKSDQTFSSEESTRAVSSETASQNKVSYLQALKTGNHKRTQSDSVRLASSSSSSSLQSDKKENVPVDLNAKDSNFQNSTKKAEQEGDNMHNSSPTPEQADPEMKDDDSDVDTVIITGSESDTLNVLATDDGQNSVSLNPEADEFTLPPPPKDHSALNPDASEFTLKGGRQGNGVFLPKSASFQYPPPLPIAYDQPLFPLPSPSKGSSSGYETPNSVETQDTLVYPDSQSTDTQYKYPSSSASRPQRFRTPPPSPMRMRSTSAPHLQPLSYPYAPNAPAYVQNMPYQVAYRQPYKVPYAVPQAYNAQYSAFPGQQYPVYVKPAQYVQNVPNAQFYGQVPAQYVVSYPPPQYAGMANMRVPHGYVAAHPQHVVPDTCAIQCGVQCMDMGHMQQAAYAPYVASRAQYPRRASYQPRVYNKRREYAMSMVPPPPPPKEDKEHAPNVENVGQEDAEKKEEVVVDEVEMQEMQSKQETQTEELLVENQQCDQSLDQ